MKTLLIFLVTVSFVFSQQESKIDTVLQNQNKMLENQQKILQKVTWKDPLEGRYLGVEFSPALLLAGAGNGDLLLSGGVSLFNIVPQAEMAFPVYYRNSDNENSSLLTIDAQYRLFFSKRRGFYASAGARYARLKGSNGYYDGQTDEWIEIENVVLNRAGIYFGIGYRYFSPLGIYWGASVILGTYLSDDSDKIDDYFMDKSRMLFDVELLKIGYVF